MAEQLTREFYDGFQRGELDRWDALIAKDVLVNSPARPNLPRRIR